MSTEPTATTPENETAGERARLAALHAYRVLDTARDPLLDHLAELAATFCGTGLSAINFIDSDRLWTKAAHGFPAEAGEQPRIGSFCNETIRSPEVTEIADMALDERFADSPYVRGDGGLRFYAGAPLVAPGGEAIGTLCVMDPRSRDLSLAQREALRRLAGIAMAVIDRYRPDRQLGALVESSPTPILFFETRGWRWRHVNASGLASLGLSIEDVEHADPAWFSPDYAPARLAARLAPLLAGRVQTVGLETEHRRLDGTRFPVEVSFSAVRSGDGPVVIAYAHDLSDRRRLAEERRERQRFFDMASEMFLILDPAGRVLQANRQVGEVLGVDPETMTDRPLSAFVAEADRAAAAAALAGCVAEAGAVERQLAFVRADGEQRLLRLRGRGDGADRIHLVASDITAWDEAQRRLRLLQNAFDASDNPFIVARLHDGQALIEYVNPSFERVTGYSAAEAVGQDCRFLQRDDRDQPAIAEMAAAIAERRSCHVTVRNYRKDGKLIYNDVLLSPVPGDDGQVTHYVGVQYDLTQLRAQQERIARLDRTQAFVAAVGRAIVRVHTEQSLLQEVCEIAVGLGGYALAWAGLLDADGGVLRPGAACGTGADAIRALTVAPARPGETPPTIASSALRSTEPTVCDDVQAAPIAEFWRQRALQAGVRSLAYLPLVRDGVVIGLYALHAVEAAAFDDEEIGLLRGVATEVAFALDSIDRARRIEYLASHDPLTGLPDAQTLEEAVDAALHPLPDPARVAVVMLDIERLKMVTDAFGKGAGEALLRDVARRLSGVGGGDGARVSRTRAGPFLVSVTGLASVEAVQAWIEDEVLHRLAQPFAVNGEPHHVSVRCGVAVSPDDGADGGTLVARAESALLQARKRGDRVAFYSPEMNAHVAQSLSIENELRRAIEREEFVLHYQPKLSLADGTVGGFEALLRWQHPQRGLVSPGNFVGILEDTGLISELAPWLVRQAVADSARLNAAGGGRRLRTAVNVSQVQMRRPDFVDSIARQLDGTAPADCTLDIEITESLLIDDAEAAIGKLQRLHELGVGIAIDDFGTGYSSLAYIARLPFDVLKIDQSFVREMQTRPESRAIVASIVTLARALDKVSVAEGVETAAQNDALRELGCTQAQGWLHARAMPLEQALAWLEARRAG